MCAIEVTFGVSFTISGRRAAAFARLTRYSSDPASAPNAMPPACTFGHDTFSSYAAIPSASFSRSITPTYSLTVYPKTFTMTLHLG